MGDMLWIFYKFPIVLQDSLISHSRLDRHNKTFLEIFTHSNFERSLKFKKDGFFEYTV